jgi:fimbrial chaperone protein
MKTGGRIPEGGPRRLPELDLGRQKIMKRRVPHGHGGHPFPPGKTKNPSNSGSRSFFLIAIALGAALSTAEPCRAGAFDVWPEQLALSSSRPTATLVIRNDSDDVMKLQLSLFEWSQDARGEMRLTPSRDVVFVPPVVEVAPGEERKVRAGAAVPVSSREKSYRLSVDYVPPVSVPGFRRRPMRGVTPVKVSIFLEPDAPVREEHLETVTLEAGLLSFAFRNSGNVHSTVQSVQVRGVGRLGDAVYEKTIPGWYVLAGGLQRYRLDIPTDDCRQTAQVFVEVGTNREKFIEQIEPSAGACPPAQQHRLETERSRKKRAGVGRLDSPASIEASRLAAR